jgi:hypothetical protein
MVCASKFLNRFFQKSKQALARVESVKQKSFPALMCKLRGKGYGAREMDNGIQRRGWGSV